MYVRHALTVHKSVQPDALYLFVQAGVADEHAPGHRLELLRARRVMLPAFVCRYKPFGMDTADPFVAVVSGVR